LGREARSTARAGLLYGAAAYGMWGLVPLYFNTIQQCPPWEIVAHRIVWSAVLLAGILTAFGRWPDARAAFRSRKTVLMLLASAYLVAGNWLVYVYSATTGQVTQASLGYFILPLVNAFAGVAIFRERLRLGQGVALAIAAVGVGYLAVSGGEFPAIALTLAVSFALYGIVRKVVPVDGVIGLSVETFLLTPVALGFLVVWDLTVGMTFGHLSRRLDVMIALSGAVTTAPLICFAQAVRKVALVTLGVLQYLSPSLQLVVAVAVNGEEFGQRHQISFGLIWVGLGVFAADAVIFAARRHLDRPSVEPVPEPIDGGLPVTDSGFTRLEADAQRG
jgi:chloramphenicol-sensitive protein RarD